MIENNNCLLPFSVLRGHEFWNSLAHSSGLDFSWCCIDRIVRDRGLSQSFFSQVSGDWAGKTSTAGSWNTSHFLRHLCLSPFVLSMWSLQHGCFRVVTHPPQILRASKTWILMERDLKQTSLQMSNSITPTAFPLLKVSHYVHPYFRSEKFFCESNVKKKKYWQVKITIACLLPINLYSFHVQNILSAPQLTTKIVLL